MVNGSLVRKGGRDEIMIFSTVFNAIKQFTRDAKPKYFVVHAEKDPNDSLDGSDVSNMTDKEIEKARKILNSREKLYIAMAKKYASKIGYKYKIFSDSYGTKIAFERG